MKRIILPILLLAISNPAVAMFGWFRKKPAVSTAVAPTTEATISAVEPVAQETVTAELQEAPATAPEIEKEAEFTLPQVEKIAGATLALPSERVLVAALNNGDVATVKQLIDEQRIDVAKPFKLLFYAGKTPLEVVLASDKSEKLEIAELLLNAGANKQDLNRFVQDAVAADDYAQVMWLLDHGAKDTEGMALELIEKKRAANQTATQEEISPAPAIEQVKAEEPIVAEELITIDKPIENYPFKAKQLLPAEEIAVTAPLAVELESETATIITPTPKQPLRLAPLRKPAAAAPRVQEVIVEITPVAKPVAPQPLRLRPTSTPAPAVARPLQLRPVTLPAPALPK